MSTERPLGPIVEPTPLKHPEHVTISGRTVKITKISADHVDDLWEATGNGKDTWLYDYLLNEPFNEKQEMLDYLIQAEKSKDPLFHAVIDLKSSKVVGWMSLMRASPEHRCVEIGSVLLTPKLQRTTQATEMFYLLKKYIFEDLCYRRCEWKCNDLNDPSKKAAKRMGYTYEGTFRKHMILKGRNRDTAWFSIVDDDWPAVKRAFEMWLDPSNFDSNGVQKRGLAELRN